MTRTPPIPVMFSDRSFLFKYKVCFINKKILFILLACNPFSSVAIHHEFLVGIEGQQYRYAERVPELPRFMRLTGWMIGINSTYKQTYENLWTASLEMRGLYGKTYYWSLKTGTANNTPNILMEPRILLGKGFSFENLDLEPYIGFGYRYKMDDSHNQKSTTGHTGYKRISNYYYIPIGVNINVKSDKLWDLKATLEFDYFICGRQYGYNQFILRNNNNPSLTLYAPFTSIHKQNKGYGLKAQLLFNPKLEDCSILIGPYIYYWNINSSNLFIYIKEDPSIYNSYEPKNHTVEAGLKVQIKF